MPIPEPWLRGTRTELPAVARAVVHAIELASEDISKWCGDLTDEELNARHSGMPPVAFHVRHIARSIDRLLTYAEGNVLSEHQRALLKTELDAGARGREVFAELNDALQTAMTRVRKLGIRDLEETRNVGTLHLPTTLGGLLVHVAEHTQRHVGQAITTAKAIRAARK